MIRQYFLPPTTLLSLHSSDVTEEAVWSYRYSPPSSHASTNSPEILFHHQHSRIIRNIRSTNRARSSSPSNLRPSRGKGYGKIRWKYIPRCILYLSTSTYIHFPSTSPLRYIARIESMSVTRNLHFPGKYTGEEGDGEDGWCAERGVKKREGWKNVPPPLLLFFPSPPHPSTVGEKGLEGEKFRAQLFNRAYRPEWFPWVSGASTNS